MFLKFLWYLRGFHGQVATNIFKKKYTKKCFSLGFHEKVKPNPDPAHQEDGSATEQCSYRDRRAERQRRWPQALLRRLATLPLSDLFPLNSNSSPEITRQ